MPPEIWLGICLWIVFEGLFVFAMPNTAQRLFLDLAQMDPKQLRLYGGIGVLAGLILLRVATT